MDMNGHSWEDKLAWVGLVWEIMCQRPGYYHVQVRIPDGLVSFGEGETLEDALSNGAHRQPLDWGNIERKMTDAAWDNIAHC